MTSVERKKELLELRDRFNKISTTDTERVDILRLVSKYAAEEMPESKCISCGKPGIAIEYPYALVEGHCYSKEGMRDYQGITNVCEYCFDRMCALGDPEDDDIPAVGPRT